MPGPLTANKPYSKGSYAITGPTGIEIAPTPGTYWRFSIERFRELDADGRIWWGKTGTGRPLIKRYLTEVGDLVPRTWWPYGELGSTRNAKLEVKNLRPDLDPFDTPKPERLMQRILHIATNPNDIVLDPFLGSGTTAAVAQKMGRRWVGVERSAATVDTFAVPRLTKVANGEDTGGITEAAGWSGGGGFRILDVAPSMFDATEGSVVIADWASNGKLSAVTAAQLGFDFEPDAPFVGRRGRSRLAVIDGLVNPDVAAVLVDALPDGDVLTLCGTAVDESTAPTLRKLRRGSVVRKIPASILADYRRPQAPPSATDASSAG